LAFRITGISSNSFRSSEEGFLLKNKNLHFLAQLSQAFHAKLRIYSQV